MNEYPLHYCVFTNDFNQLKSLLTDSKENIEQKDNRGKTPLELAIFLNHFECANVLCQFGADCNVITRQGWNLLQEAVSTANIDLVKLIYRYRDYQRTINRRTGINEMLNKLKQAPDFYVEMKWEFTSWIPLVAKACPSDVYKIYKSGSNVRIDTTLVGFDGTSWDRGNRSYIFKVTNNGGASIIEIDHLARTVYADEIKLDIEEDIDDSAFEPNERVIQAKLTSPNMTTFLDIEKIEFERNRSGMWGMRSDKSEAVNDYQCKVYTANNLQLVTKTRIEHLSEQDKVAFQNSKGNSMPNMPSFISTFIQGTEHHVKNEKSKEKISAQQYFQKHYALSDYLDREIDENKKIQTFNATLSLCDDYPLSLHEQLLPIVDIMALNNSHFKKLKEFITLQLPAGFPVKIQIPVYRVITAKVTFGNIHGVNLPVKNVTTILAGNASEKMCIVDESVFSVPPGYKSLSSNLMPHVAPVDEEDILLQLAIQQSLSDGSQVAPTDEQLTAMEMFGYREQSANTRFNQFRYDAYAQEDDDLILQRVLAESLLTTDSSTGATTTPAAVDTNFLHHTGALTYDLQQVLELSRREEERREQLRKQEDDELERIIRLSLEEK